MNKGKITTLKERVESEFNKMFIHKAYIQYYYDSQHKESILKPIQKIPLVLRIPNYQEAFILRKPNHYLNGRPVFVVIRGYPLSIETDLSQTTKKAEIEIIDGIDISKTVLKVKDTLLYHKNPDLLLEMKDFDSKLKTNKKHTPKHESYNKESIIIRTNILEKREIEKHSSFELDTWIQTSYNNVLLKKKMMSLEVIVVWIMTIFCTALGTWLIADNYLEGYYREKFKSSNLIIPIIEFIRLLCLIMLLMV